MLICLNLQSTFSQTDIIVVKNKLPSAALFYSFYQQLKNLLKQLTTIYLLLIGHQQ